MKSLYAISILTAVLAGAIWLYAHAGARPALSVTNATVAPILVELFTSEGCSSCPPADALLQKFDAQPVAGAQLIVLSEHVDYWNHIGWKDPFSSSAFSERQSIYGRRLHLESVYTPQMVVDGTREFVGSSYGEAQQAFAKAETDGKVAVQIRDLEVKDGNLRAHIESGPLPASIRKADVVLAIALNRAESQVAHGENAGRHLTHVAVVRSLTNVGSSETGRPFSEDVTVKLDHEVQPDNLRVIAFLQESGQGRVLGAATAMPAR